MAYKFTQDYVTVNEETWKTVLGRYVNSPNTKILEIGSYEGRSTIWFLENILTHETAEITCLDHFFCESFYLNISKFAPKVRLVTNNSQIALRDKSFLVPCFDVIYIDGGHSAPDVIADAILSFTSLKIGGILIFDDYLWDDETFLDKGKVFNNEEIIRQQPKLAIDAFISIYFDSLELIHKEYQVILRKKRNSNF